MASAAAADGAGAVDAHVHVFRAQSDDYPRESNELFPDEREATVEDLLREMGANGVSQAVLVPLAGEDRYVAECRAAQPGRFASVIVLDSATPDPVETARRRIRETGAGGIRLFGLGPGGPSVEQMHLFDLWRFMRDEGLILSAYLPAEEYSTLEALLEALPELKVVLNHCALPLMPLAVDGLRRPMARCALPPPQYEIVTALARFPNVYVMFSGHYGFSAESFPFEDTGPMSRAAASAFGPERLMWASDFPWPVDEPGYGRLLSLVDHFLPDLTPQERASVRGGNCRELFGLPAP